MSWQLICWLEKNFQTQYQKGMGLLRIKSRENVVAASTEGRGWPPDRLAGVDAFSGLVANFYSLKIKKIPVEGWMIG